MIVEKIIYNLTRHPSGKRVDIVTFDWFEQSKKLLWKTTQSGEEIGLSLSVPLRDGDVLFEDGQRIIVAELAPCELIRIEAADMRSMGLLCFELGNRHSPIVIEDGRVTALYDAPTFELLVKMGFCCRRESGKFSGFTESRAHSHMGGHGHG